MYSVYLFEMCQLALSHAVRVQYLHNLNLDALIKCVAMKHSLLDASTYSL